MAQAQMKMDAAAMSAELEKLKNENAALKAAAAKKNTISFKVSEKGALSVYGLGRFPVTLYKEQWERLIASLDQMKAFITLNSDKLTVKQ